MAALPIAMLGATLLGGIGAYIANTTSDTKDYIQLISGQRIRIETRVRLNTEGKEKNPDSCLVMQEGRVTRINADARKVTVQCKKSNKVEEHDADNLDVTDSGINAPGIDIAGGWAVEGSQVRLLLSAKRSYPGRGLASPFYKAVGTIVAIDKARKEVHVTSESLNSKTDTATWFYNSVDLELVARPLTSRRRGVYNGEIQEGSTVRLKVGPDGAISPDVLKKYAQYTHRKLADPKNWEKTGKVTAVIEDPKDDTKTWVRVLCVSKKSRGTVEEEQYDANDLEAVPATSIPRSGIPIFGGMAEEGVHVRVRAERKDAVSSKPLGRPAFGDVGTVTRVDGDADDNLKVFVTCNGQNPDEQTGDWYEPEDLEVADAGETEGEPVFGGRVVVGSMVRVMQSGRGKKCLGTMEVGDIGSVKGIDPNGADNLKINVTCGRSPTAKQSEWYDPRDLQVFFGVEDAGTPLAQARSALDIAERALAKQRRAAERDPAEEARLQTAVDKAQARVNKLSKETVDMTKTKEVYENTREKLQNAQKLKRDIESLRLTASKQTTCAADPGRVTWFTQKFQEIETTYYTFRQILNPSAEIWNNLIGPSMKPLQYSDRFKSAWKDLYRTWQNKHTPDPANDPTPKYEAKLAIEMELRTNLQQTNRDSPEQFDDLGDVLRRLSDARIAYDNVPMSPLKSDLNSIGEKLHTLKEIARDMETAAYSGNTPTEKLLARIGQLITENNAKQDIIEGPAPTRGAGELGPLTTAYNKAFADEQQAKFEFEVSKQNFQKNTTYSAVRATQVADFQVNEAQRIVDALRATPVPATQAADHNKRIAKAEEDLRKKTAERDIKRAYNPLATTAVPQVETPKEIVTALTEASRKYIEAQKATLKARKAEQIKSGELTCLLQSTEAATELQDKIRKIVEGKCKILADADTVNAKIDDLIDTRKRAFLTAQAAFDPSFGRVQNTGQFAVPIGTDFAGRIQLINDALARITANPTIAGLQELVELSGTYGGDMLLDQARAVTQRTYRGGAFFDRPPTGIRGVKKQKENLLTNLTKQSQLRRAQAPLPEYTRVNPTIYSSPTGPEISAEQQEQEELDRQDIDEMNADAHDAAVARQQTVERGFENDDEYDRRYREAQANVEEQSRDKAMEFKTKYDQDKRYNDVRKNMAIREEAEEQRKKKEEDEAKRKEAQRKLDVERQRALFAARASNLTADARKRAEKEQEDEILRQGGPELLAAWKKDTKAKEEGARWMAREKDVRRIQREKQEALDRKQNAIRDKAQALQDKKDADAQAMIDAQKKIEEDNAKLTQDILDVSDRLAKDQIIRLKMNVVSNSTAVDLAQQLTTQGDKLEQEIRDSRTEFQFNVAQRGGASSDDFKIQNDVDYYKEELEKSKVCIVNFKKKAIDQYNVDMLNLEQKKEEMKSKIFEIKEPQDVTAKSKDWNERSKEEIIKEIANVKARLAVPGIKPDEKASKEKFLAKLKTALSSKSGGYYRRVTLRRPRNRVY